MTTKRGKSIDFLLLLCHNGYMIFQTIKNQTRASGSKVALVGTGKQYTYSELIKSVEQLAAILSTAVLPGERILFASNKDYHYVRMVLACEILGITFMPTVPGLSEEELDNIDDLHLLTNKKFVYACNVSEDMMDTPEVELQSLI